MWELDHKEGWVLKNGCFWTVVLEKTLESPLDCKEIKPVNPKGNQPWIFIGRTDAEAGAPIVWPPDAKSQLTRKDPDAGKDWRQEEKGTTEDEMVGWHHWLNGHELDVREAWHAAIHGVAKNWTWLRDWTTTNYPSVRLGHELHESRELVCLIHQVSPVPTTAPDRGDAQQGLLNECQNFLTSVTSTLKMDMITDSLETVIQNKNHKCAIRSSIKCLFPPAISIEK